MKEFSMKKGRNYEQKKINKIKLFDFWADLLGIRIALRNNWKKNDFFSSV